MEFQLPQSLYPKTSLQHIKVQANLIRSPPVTIKDNCFALLGYDNKSFLCDTHIK